MRDVDSPAVFEFMKARIDGLESQESFRAGKTHVVYDLVLVMLAEPQIRLRRFVRVDMCRNVKT